MYKVIESTREAHLASGLSATNQQVGGLDGLQYSRHGKNNLKESLKVAHGKHGEYRDWETTCQMRFSC